MMSTFGTMWDVSCERPIAAATAVIASSTGTPAATRAPNVTSRTISVAGRDSSSALAKSSSSCLPTEASSEASPACPTTSCGCAAAYAVTACCRSGTRSAASSRAASPVSPSTASRTDNIADWPSADIWGRSTSSTTGSERSSAARAAADSGSPVAELPGAGWTRTCSMIGSGKPAAATLRSALPDWPDPSSASEISLVPAADPMTRQRMTKVTHPAIARHGWRADQRATVRTAPERCMGTSEGHAAGRLPTSHEPLVPGGAGAARRPPRNRGGITPRVPGGSRHGVALRVLRTVSG